MTPEAQRIAMATLDGWSDFRRDLTNPDLLLGSKSYGHLGREELEVPRYLTDLNAAHAVLWAVYDQGYSRLKIAQSLNRVVGRPTWGCFDATAGQMTETILRATGKWDDSK